MKSHIPRTLKSLRDQGWTAEKVERWIPGANVRKDFLGFIDIIALRGTETLAVQVCGYTGVSGHIKKIEASEALGAVRDANWKIEVWGWRKVKNRYQPRIIDVS